MLDSDQPGERQVALKKAKAFVNADLFARHHADERPQRGFMPKAKNARNFTLDPSVTGPFNSEERSRLVNIMKAELTDPGSSEYFVYSRYWNPTVAEAEDRLANIELSNNDAWVALTSSGMAAIDCALSIYQDPNWPPDKTWLLYPTELYGGTLKYIKDVLIQRRGIRVEKFKITDVLSAPKLTDQFIEKMIEEKPAVVFLEPVTNPTLCVFNIRKIIKEAHNISTRVIIDNTFTPFAIRPLEFEPEARPDLVVHSVTKSISGHGNITAGMICGLRSGEKVQLPGASSEDPARTLEAAVRDWRKTVGCVISPRDAFELHSQLETLELRIRTANDNAGRIARLVSDQNVEVLYPGLENHPNSDAVSATFSGAFGHGSMIAINLNTESAMKALMDRLDSHNFKCRLTLGDLATSFLPVRYVFGDKRFDERYEGLLRVSVGIEPIEDLEKAFDDSLAK